MMDFELESWVRDSGGLAVLVPAGQLFGTLTREIRVPSGIVALARRRERDYVLAGPGRLLSGAGVVEVLWAKAGPWRVAIQDDSLRSREGYGLSAEATVVVRPIERESELRALGETLVGPNAAMTAADLEAHLRPGIVGALRGFSESRSAEAVVGGDDAKELADLGSKGLAEAIFGAGLRIEKPLQAEFECQALTQLRVAEREALLEKDMRAVRAELDDALHADRLEQLRRVREVFAEVAQLAESTPGRRVEQLLSQFDEEHRGAIYEATLELAEDAEPARRVLLAAGTSILWIAPGSPDEIAGSVDLGDELGGARCVAEGWLQGRRCLLVGAGRGVHVLDAETRQPEYRLVFQTDTRVRGGFNAVATLGARVLATHSELGLIVWNSAESPGRCLLADRTRGAKTVRCVTAVDGDRLALAIDEKVLVLSPDDGPTVLAEYAGGEQRVTALAPWRDDLYVGDEAGRIVRWPHVTDAAPEVRQPPGGSAIGSLLPATLGSVDRLIFTSDVPWVTVRVLGDSFSTQYSAPRAIRWAAIAGNHLVAIDQSRCWIHTWAIGRPQNKPTALNVADIVGSRIQHIIGL